MKKLVAITGASSGIGEATARAFAREGHPLLLMARRLERLEALGLPNSLCKAVDVRNRGQIDAALAEAEARFGPTDLLVNNAGLMQLGKISDQDPNEWQNMVDINVVAPLGAWLSLLPISDARFQIPNPECLVPCAVSRIPFSCDSNFFQRQLQILDDVVPIFQAN